jgi:hypothetical protein
MNWKRGLTRVFVVAWAGIAVVGAFFAYSSSDEALQPRRELQEFLRRNNGLVSLKDLRALRTDSLEYRIAQYVGPVKLRSPRGVVRRVDPDSFKVGLALKEGYSCDTLALQDLKPDYSGRTPLERAQEAARGDRALEAIVWAWVLWILLCGVAPATLLVIVAWVVSGFTK